MLSWNTKESASESSRADPEDSYDSEKENRLDEKQRELLVTPLMRTIFARQKKRKSPASPLSEDELAQANDTGIKLKKYQLQPAVFLRTHRGLIVAHGTGTGKTLTAIHAVESLFDELSDPHLKALIITPKSLVSNFKDNLAKYNNARIDRYEFISKDTFARKMSSGDLSCSSKIVVMDEAHSTRNTTTMLYAALAACSKEATRIILLTATPIFNSVFDIVPLLELIHPLKAHDYSKEKLAGLLEEPGSTGLRDFLACSFSIADADKTNFPKQIDHYVHLHMNSRFLASYNASESLAHIPDEVRRDIFQGRDSYKVNAFFLRMRRTTNADFGKDGYTESGSNPKLDWIIGFLTQKWPDTVQPAGVRLPLPHGSGKVVVSTAWGAAGAARIATRCAENGLPCIIYSGILDTTQRDLLVAYYNKYDRHKPLVLVLMSAGGVGLDLKETKYVIVLDVPWNPSTRDQAIARGVRYESHASSAAEVNVYNLILQKPPRPWYLSWLSYVKRDFPSSDTIFTDRIERKTAERQRIATILNKVNVESAGASCPTTS